MIHMKPIRRVGWVDGVGRWLVVVEWLLLAGFLLVGWLVLVCVGCIVFDRSMVSTIWVDG